MVMMEETAPSDLLAALVLSNAILTYLPASDLWEDFVAANALS